MRTPSKPRSGVLSVSVDYVYARDTYALTLSFNPTRTRFVSATWDLPSKGDHNAIQLIIAESRYWAIEVGARDSQAGVPALRLRQNGYYARPQADR